MLYFATTNLYKFTEFERLFKKHGITLIQYDFDIPELLTYDMGVLVRDKLVKAYARLGRPVMVDASGLGMNALNGLPQGLNRQFWEIFKNQPCDLAQKLGDNKAEAIVYLGLCDGFRKHVIVQRSPGTIALAPSGPVVFHIDRVFIPNGATKTLGQMSESERDKFSHRFQATEKAVALIKREKEFLKKIC